MRLKPAEVKAFIEVLAPELKGVKGKLYLYGSRTDDSLKGGDIDLLLVVEQAEKAHALAQRKAFFINQFQKRIGERRIDFAVVSESESKTDVFYTEALAKAIVLFDF